MDRCVKQRVSRSVENFRLPRYEQLPAMGLYLEQVTKYISDQLSALAGVEITSSMISNYVKKGLVDKPIRKQYSRSQIAYLMYIAVIKTALSMEDIGLTVRIQKASYSEQIAYDYFCSELENVLEFMFGLKNDIAVIGMEETDEKIMLRNTIITVAHKVYLNALFAELRRQDEKNLHS